MKRILAVVFLGIVCIAGYAESDDGLSVLSGSLHKSRPKESLMPYYLKINVAGGGNQIVILRGEVLHKFDKEITRFGEVWPVRVKGHIKTKWIESATPQPAPAGWLLWLEVEKATIDLPSPEERKRDAKEWQ